ncbi:alkaline phosphatase family protein [Gordonia otitidis]|uniref:alkaline phosphatase family protein n=1 Tax=Gordonia otitidis TaxID=249058 RepID=UPI0023579D46|nr:alkaline phosphatase family protein [Gordonia otitidis]
MTFPYLHDLLGDIFSIVPRRPVILFLVDGLGEEQLQRYAAAAPLLSDATQNRHTRVADYPSSTPASVMSILTASAPAHHGIVGCEYRVDHAHDLFNPLLCDPASTEKHDVGVDTFFLTLRRTGMTPTYVVPAGYVTSGFTEMSGDGATVRGYSTPSELEHALETPGLFTYAYYSELDKAGHVFGVGSPEWLRALTEVDGLVMRIKNRLAGRDVDLIITSDHGMINVDNGPSHRFDLCDDSELAEGVLQMGGDARAPFLYCEEGARDSVRRRWAARFGKESVVTPDDAVDQGWIPSPSPLAKKRYGDLLISLPANIVVFDSRAMERPTSNIGFHGARTLAERLVPVIRFEGGAE